MRLLFIRHAEPDYTTDSLTEKGKREAALLAAAAPAMDLGHCFVSPLGRARETARICMEAVGKTAQVMPWLEEFDGPVDLNRNPELVAAYPGVKPVEEEIRETESLKSLNGGHTGIAGSFAARPLDSAGEKGEPAGRTSGYRLRRPWDIGQKYYAAHPELADSGLWRESEIYLKSGMPKRYAEVAQAFDALLAEHGYVHENGLYRVERENRETLTFFCHFGIICVLLSIVWNVSPFFLWQSLVMLPSTVTELISEEREQGAALFRAQRIGDQSHLYHGGELPSFAARFCEVYSDFSEETGRH